MKKVFLFEKHVKTSEDCDKDSKSVSYETLVGGTTTSGIAYEQTQCLSKCSAKTPLDAVGTFPAISDAAKVMEKSSQTLPVFRFVRVLSLAVFLSISIISDRWAEEAQECNCDGIEYCACEIISSSCGADCHWSINNGVLTITGSGAMDNFGIELGRGTHEDPDKSIFPPWRFNNFNSVVIDGLSSVGDFTFDGYSALQNVSLSESVKTIGRAAFVDTHIESLNMPGVTTIGEGAFENAHSLTSVNAPNVTTIGDFAFNYATSLTSVDMPNVTSIGYNAFSDSGLIYINIPSNAQCNVTGSLYMCETSINDEISGTPLFNNSGVNQCVDKNGYITCGSCGGGYVMPGRGCVSDCGNGNLVKNGRCIDSADGCGNGYILEGKNCALDYEWLDDNTLVISDDLPEITEDIFGLSTTLGDATKIICRGDIEKCKDLLKNYPKYYDITDGYGNINGGYYAPTDMSNLATSATEANCESGRYYWSGTSCNNKKNGINCEENFKQMETWCNRIRYTPADAAKVLKDTDNEIIMTFKVNR